MLCYVYIKFIFEWHTFLLIPRVFIVVEITLVPVVMTKSSNSPIDEGIFMFGISGSFISSWFASPGFTVFF